MTQALITAELPTKHLVRRKKVDAACSRPFEQQHQAILDKYRVWHALLCGSQKNRILPDQCRAQQISGLPAACSSIVVGVQSKPM
jgi:hypothetical protein